MAICEAIVNFNAATLVIADSFNVASVTLSAPTYFNVNFTTPISTVNYIALCTCGNGAADSQRWNASGPSSVNPTVNSFPMWNGNAGTKTALNFSYCAIFTN